jgi:serine/threonine protein phosphatase PrpC
VPRASLPPEGPSLAFEVAVATHPGLVRTRNEDAALVRADLGLYVVADGMGGHDQGERASAALVQRLDTLAEPASASGFLDAVTGAVTATHADLVAIAALEGVALGTTFVALLLFGADYAILWAGDSRAYRLRSDHLVQLSCDHSEVQDLVASRALTVEEARRWPGRHVVTRAVGMGEIASLELAHGTAREGDVFLLCSDGLTEHCRDEDIAALLSHPPSRACAALVDLTLQRGGSDNVTVLVLRCAAATDLAGRQTVHQPGGRRDER